MLPKLCIVRTYRDLFTPAAVRAYRHYGFVLVERFLEPPHLRHLTALCNTTARQRGEKVFPGLDPQHQHGASTALRADLKPKPQPPVGQAASPTLVDGSTPVTTPTATNGLRFGTGQIPADVLEKAAEVDRQRRFETHTRKVHLTLKSKRAVDRAFRKLTRSRDRYNAYKKLHQYVGHEEEMTGEMPDERIREVREKYTYDDLKRGFQEYRDSGLLEKELRHEHHVNDVMRFFQNWPRTWCWMWRDSDELREFAVSATGPVGQRVGEAAGQLSGEVLLRVYCDSAAQDTPLTNAVPLGFAGAGTNFAHPQALSVQLGLEVPADAPRRCASRTEQVVIPGSHHVIQRLSHNGKEMDRFGSGGVFDVGSMARSLPEVAHLPVVPLPPLPPGSALLFNNYLLMGIQPSLTGLAREASAPANTTPFTHVSSYSLSLLPDRCAFDGQRNSWAARDTHGPLYAYKRGDLLTDDKVFPVVHRALDIE